jgi:drug/metabolite transporter (DMT)-like permease
LPQQAVSSSPRRRALRIEFNRLDPLLALMTLIWGANYSIVKVALRELPPHAFNSLRLCLASLLFLAALALGRRAAGESLSRRSPAPSCRAIPWRDWLAIAILGIIGHFIYQICFMGGIARTTVSNTSLIFGCSPVAVALLTAAAGHERVRSLQWAGAGLSVVGVYMLVGQGPTLSRASLEGDLLLIAGLFCWAIYTVGSRFLLDRHTPLVVTGYSMAIGTACYVAFGMKDLASLDWARVSMGAWAALVFSAVFALFVSYLIWYTAVRAIGNVRTSVYSNITPLVALLVAIFWLGERLTPARAAGAAAILIGAALTRLVRPAPEPAAE